MEKLKTFFRNRYVRFSWNSLILLTCIPFLFYSYFIIKNAIFSDKEILFNRAGNFQGSYYSDYTFDYLLKKYPKNSKFWWESSVAYNKRGDHEIGMKRLKNATHLDPLSHLGYSGWIKLDKLKDYENALKDFHQLDKISKTTEYPWGDNIYYRMAICYQGLEKYDSAMLYYNKYFDSEKDKKNIIPITYTYLGKMKADLNLNKEALELYNKTISIDSNTAEAYYYKAETFNKLNMKDSAKFNYIKSLDLTNKSYKKADPYNEVFLEIYSSQIEDKLNELK